MHDDLGVGSGQNLITGRHQLFAQFGMILNDPVVHQRDAITGHMRMRVELRGFAVSGPACMCNSRIAAIGAVTLGGFELAHLAFAFMQTKRASAVDKRHAGRIIATVLKPSQALEQNLGHFPPRSGSHDATHSSVPGGVFGRSLPTGYVALSGAANGELACLDGFGNR